MKTNAVDNIEKNLNSLFEISKRYLSPEQVLALKDEYQAKKNESLLQIMLFGSYNAGKSSLINALLMEEVAAVGDIPKTATADTYIWNNCYLMDTPGVNAPIEHEAITEAQIDRSELILFVIRQGDQDVKDVYDRMFSLLARDKQVFIVFNHELSSDELPEALSRLTEIMAQYAETYQINLQRVGELPVIPINIKTALKARLKGSDALAEHSGVVQFEGVFLSWLRSFDSDCHYLDRLRKYIHQCLITPLLDSISYEEAEADLTELKNLQYQRDEVVRQYDLLDSQAANHVRAELVRLKPKIASAICSSSSKIEIESEIMQLAEGVVETTADFLQQRCEEVTNDLNAVIDVSVETASDGSRSQVFETIEKALVGGARNLDSGTIKDGFLMLRKFKVPGVKGRWEKTLGGWATKAGWVVTAVVSAYEIYTASAEQDKQNAEQRKQILGIHQVVETVASDISSSILDEARKIIFATKEQSLVQITLSIKDITENCEQHTRDTENVRSLTSSIDAVNI